MELLKGGSETVIPSTDNSSLIFICKALYAPIIAVGCLWIALIVWHVPVQGPNFLLMVLTFFGTAFLLDGSNLQAINRYRDIFGAYIDTLMRWAFIVGFIWMIFFSADMQAVLDRRVLAMWILMTPIAIVSSRVLIGPLVFDYSRRHVQVRKAVVIGATELGLRLSQELHAQSPHGIEVVGFFEERASERLTIPLTTRPLGGLKDLPEYIASHGIHLAYITLPMSSHPRILDLLDSLKNSTVSIYFVPDLFVFDLIQARFDMINGIPVVAVCESPFHGIRGVVKRISDVVLGILMLLLIWPLLVAIAIGVALSSPGPVLFKQRRYGLDGKEIVVYKFRTMTVCEDGAEIRQAARNDNRVTSFGQILRTHSLDELPQLINVLQGRMSLIGPRPHAVAHNEMYRYLIKGYMVRHKVKPGITGLAQINGCRGETDTVEKMQARIHYDIEYLRHWSLGLDFEILLRTVRVLGGDKHAY